MTDKIKALVYNEREVAQLLRVDRSTIRRQALTEGTALNACVIYVTENTRRYPCEAVHQIAAPSIASVRKAA